MKELNDLEKSISITEKSALGLLKKSQTQDSTPIREVVAQVFATRNLLHFQHWNTKSYAAHMALGDMYDQIVDDVDEIVEVYQGKYGLVDGLFTAAATLPPTQQDVIERIKYEHGMVSELRSVISGGETSIENLIDTLLGHYLRCIYKLTNLH